MSDELIEQVARALWEVQHNHWSMYRQTAVDMGLLIPYSDLSTSKQNELKREATAAIALIRPAVLEEAAKVARVATAYDDALQTSAGCHTTGERIAAAIRALMEQKDV